MRVGWAVGEVRFHDLEVAPDRIGLLLLRFCFDDEVPRELLDVVLSGVWRSWLVWVVVPVLSAGLIAVFAET